MGMKIVAGVLRSGARWRCAVAAAKGRSKGLQGSRQSERRTPAAARALARAGGQHAAAGARLGVGLRAAGAPLPAARSVDGGGTVQACWAAQKCRVVARTTLF